MKFEENWPRVSEEKSLKGLDRRQTDGQETTDYGRGVITIVHPEPTAQVS